MSFVQRKIALTFQLGQGTFGATGYDTVKLPDGLRVSATISKAGGPAMVNCQLRIFGMDLKLMNQLTILQKALTQVRRNTVTVEAGDDQNGMAVVFTGLIQEAWADMQSSPEASFFVDAHLGLFEAMKPVAPISFKGSVDVALAMNGIAQKMGASFENSGVSVQLSNPYLPGTLWDQAKALAQAAGINMIFDQGVLAIWPRGSARKGAAVLLNKDTGLVGYPSFTSQGVVVTSEFNPSISFGGTIKVESVLTPANGSWTPFNIQHELESQTPGGKWFTHAEATFLGHLALPT